MATISFGPAPLGPYLLWGLFKFFGVNALAQHWLSWMTRTACVALLYISCRGWASLPVAVWGSLSFWAS